MAAVMVLAGLALTAVAVFVTFAVVAVVFKILFKLVLLPLLLLKWIVTGLVMLIVGPILFLVGLAAFLAVGVALFVPLLPFAVLGAIVWLIVKSSRPAAVA
jgi:hypothetical protein